MHCIPTVTANLATIAIKHEQKQKNHLTSVLFSKWFKTTYSSLNPMQYNKSAYTVKMKPMLLFKWLDKLQTSYLTQLLVQLGFAAIIR